jgi:hypothetical protein
MNHAPPTIPPTGRELRDFGLLVGGVLLLLAGLSFWRGRSGAVFGSLALIGATLVGLGALAPVSLSATYRGWMRLALLMSKVTTPVLMGAIYFLVVTPIGVIRRLFGKNSLTSRGKESAWITRAPDSRASSLERQF